MLVLDAEAIVEGHVVDFEGRPVSVANVSLASSGGTRFGVARTQVDREGRFILRGLPPGDVSLSANDNGRRKLKASTRLVVQAGVTAWWDPVLDEGDVLTGRLVDERGDPMQGVYVYAINFGGTHWYTGVHTDRDGRFRATQRPKDGAITLNITPPGAAAPIRVVRDIGVNENDVEIRVLDQELPSGSISGRLVDSQGAPVSDAQIKVAFAGYLSPTYAKVDRVSGRFRIEPLPPRIYMLKVLTGWQTARDLGAIPVEKRETVELGDVLVESR